MGDWTPVAIRFAVYAALCLVFGLPLQRLHAGIGPIHRAWLVVPVVAGLVASVIHLLAMVAAMAGGAMLPVDGEILRVILAGTASGTAFIVRFVALAGALGMACLPGIDDRVRLAGVTTGGGVALATLAWAGHGAMDEGIRGDMHLAADIVHLLAAGGWIGGIAALLTMLPSAAPGDAAIALRRFAPLGSLLVALIVASGIVNGAMILGVDSLPRLGTTLYGRILLAKLVLFAAMLALAAANRWIVTPRMAVAGDRRPARISLSAELLLGLIVLAAVGWLGTLSPDA